MTLTIRSRREEDLPSLASTLVSVHAVDGYPVEGVADPKAWLRHPREIQSWTAAQDGEPIGQVTLARAQPEDDAAVAWHEYTGGDVDRLAVLARLFVAPGHRGSSAGRLLMETARDFARSRRLAVALDVMLKDRGAIRLYERLGAERISDIDHRYGDGLTEAGVVYVI
ncbi:GNAT family N-acetyltransferase [Promicromonospora sp. NFX87]|uniref:GNAT family N-acetyltransferase n=1 Tax=Promicromonospora sp. NFX87 TaxID=3402691 RepID=UPI003AFB5D90